MSHNLHKLKKNQLHHVCKHLKLHTSGNKSILINRILSKLSYDEYGILINYSQLDTKYLIYILNKIIIQDYFNNTSNNNQYLDYIKSLDIPTIKTICRNFVRSLSIRKDIKIKVSKSNRNDSIYSCFTYITNIHQIAYELGVPSPTQLVQYLQDYYLDDFVTLPIGKRYRLQNMIQVNYDREIPYCIEDYCDPIPELPDYDRVNLFLYSAEINLVYQDLVNMGPLKDNYQWIFKELEVILSSQELIQEFIQASSSMEGVDQLTLTKFTNHVTTF